MRRKQHVERIHALDNLELTFYCYTDHRESLPVNEETGQYSAWRRFAVRRTVCSIFANA